MFAQLKGKHVLVQGYFFLSNDRHRECEMVRESEIEREREVQRERVHFERLILIFELKSTNILSNQLNQLGFPACPVVFISFENAILKHPNLNLQNTISFLRTVEQKPESL